MSRIVIVIVIARGRQRQEPVPTTMVGRNDAIVDTAECHLPLSHKLIAPLARSVFQTWTDRPIDG
jgi:hypothetical protein